jgi:hypothetical protein
MGQPSPLQEFLNNYPNFLTPQGTTSQVSLENWASLAHKGGLLINSPDWFPSLSCLTSLNSMHFLGSVYGDPKLKEGLKTHSTSMAIIPLLWLRTFAQGKTKLEPSLRAQPQTRGFITKLQGLYLQVTSSPNLAGSDYDRSDCFLNLMPHWDTTTTKQKKKTYLTRHSTPKKINKICVWYWGQEMFYFHTFALHLHRPSSWILSLYLDTILNGN